MGSSCNETQQDWDLLGVPFNLQVIFGIIIIMLVLSLCWNMFCCVSKCSSGKGLFKPRTRQRRSQRQMEDNPIYGNIGLQSSTALFTEVEPQDSSSLRDQHRVNSESQSKTQDCYANLTLKAPRQQSGRVSPQIQYSDVVHLEEAPESDKEDEGNADGVSTMSDLYASVQNQRTKTVTTADSGEGYANHL
ncbi:signaling threshold-regulating transmembrane adapter 1-like isoform X2 [Cebidichthys violaceus]|uniref:signaling threshold-regulating transmembrane adapter 1-like isoform X2 n=1 Tax=Cebidichthys violaceus TaxID=271503 RepID=UPI0035CAA57E